MEYSYIMLTTDDLKKIKRVISPLEKDIKDVKKTVDTISRLFDAADVRIERRVKRIEEHLSLPDKN